MAILGWVVCLGVLIWVTFALFATWRFGGIDLSPLSYKEYWWSIPLVLIDGTLWYYLLFVYSPFTLIVR